MPAHPKGACRVRARVAVFGTLSCVGTAPSDGVVLAGEGVTVRGGADVAVVCAVCRLGAAVRDWARLTLPGDTGLVCTGVAIIAVAVVGAAASVGQVHTLA